MTTVAALVREGLRIEMYWNGPPDRSCDQSPAPPNCDASDVDLHLLRQGGTRWFESTDDCYYANCTRVGVEWGSPSPLDNPRLDIDDVQGFGPENINIDAPIPGTYRIGVHYYDDDAPVGNLPATVTVRVYCSSTSAVAMFGPVTLYTDSTSSDQNDFWKVADVTIPPAGRCLVTSLAVNGQPNIVSRAEAMQSR